MHWDHERGLVSLEDCLFVASVSGSSQPDRRPGLLLVSRNGSQDEEQGVWQGEEQGKLGSIHTTSSVITSIHVTFGT